MRGGAEFCLRAVLAIPFAFSAISKFADFDYFLLLVYQSQVIPGPAKKIAYVIPILDLMAILSFLVRKRVIVLLFPLLLYTFYTIYLLLVFLHGIQTHSEPCGCRGLFGFLNIEEHLILNLVFIALNAGLVLSNLRDRQKNSG